MPLKRDPTPTGQGFRLSCLRHTLVHLIPRRDAFDYDDYQKKVNGLTTEQLHKEWEIIRAKWRGATSTATQFSSLL